MSKRILLVVDQPDSQGNYDRVPVALPNARFWHKADIATGLNVASGCNGHYRSCDAAGCASHLKNRNPVRCHEIIAMA